MPSAIHYLVEICRRDDYSGSFAPIFLFCLQAENRYSYSSSMTHYSHSHKRHRHSHSHCYSTDQRHGNETLYLSPFGIAHAGERAVFSDRHALRFFALLFFCFIFLTFYSEIDISPRKASREPRPVPETDDAPFACAHTTPPYASALPCDRPTTRQREDVYHCPSA